MRIRIWAFAFALWFMSFLSSSAFAQTFGPVSSYDELSSAVAQAQDGDTILLSGDISASTGESLSISALVHLKSEDSAVVRGLHLKDSSVTLSGINFQECLTIDGTSHVSLGNGVTVSGTAESAALAFSGNGVLIIEHSCTIQGGNGAAGISIRHDGGEFYSSIEGYVVGGDGSSGGTGMIVSPLKDGGALMITGSIKGGSGASLGGHALNLYDLSGNAYITVGGTLQGGDGSIGGDGIQIVSASDHVSVGINGQVKGGQGESFGGNALIMMNTEDASSVNLSGHLSGGDAIGDDAQPGTSLHLVGDSAALRARIDNCILEEGKQLRPAPEPDSEPVPEPASDAADSPETTIGPVEATPSEPIEESLTPLLPKPESELPPILSSDASDAPMTVNTEASPGEAEAEHADSAAL